MLSTKQRFWLRSIVISLVSAFVAWGLAQFVAYNIFSTSAFTSTEKSTDFELSDLYQSAASRRAVGRVSSKIVIVGIDDLDRDGIAATLDAISFMEPKAIGVDLMFPYRRYGDELLLEALRTDVPIVLTADVQFDRKERGFVRHPGNWFDPLPDADYGVVNFPVDHIQNVIRYYTPSFQTKDSLYYSFALAVARAAGVALPQKKGKQMIYYPSVDFEKYAARDLVSPTGVPRLDAAENIAGKIVLVGTLDDPSDQYLTPIDPAMNGVWVHATILDNLLTNTSVRYAPRWLEILLAWLLCFVLVLFMNIAKEKWSNVGNLSIRVFQILLLYLLFVIGCNLFIRHYLYFNLSRTLLMIGLGAFAFDLINGLRALFLKLKKK